MGERRRRRRVTHSGSPHHSILAAIRTIWACTDHTTRRIITKATVIKIIDIAVTIATAIAIATHPVRTQIATHRMGIVG